MTIKKVSEITGVREQTIQFYIRMFKYDIIRNNGIFVRYDIDEKEVPFIKWWYTIGRKNHKRIGKTIAWRQKIRKEFLDYYGITEEELAAK